MGPILIFDKSTLQSLSLDESVWLEHFFLNNITPLFYVETLGDLALEKTSDGRPVEVIIGELISKTPINGAHPNIHHQRLVLGSLLGQGVEMSGRPIIDGGVTKITPEGKIGIHFGESPETQAMNRWHKGEYLEVEKEFARTWRQTLSSLTFDRILGVIKNVVPNDSPLSNTGQIKNFVERFVHGNYKELLYLAFDLLGIPDNAQSHILQRWEKEKNPPFDEFAPYASYVFKIDLFFYICMLRGFESKGRPSHKIDLSYLYYLPFCSIFVSNDKLHERIAPLFMNDKQVFIKGQEFKSGLKELDEHFSKLPDDIKEAGIFSFATYPPRDSNSAIAGIWDKIFPNWRQQAEDHGKKGNLPEDKELLKRLKDEQENSRIAERQATSDQADHVMFTRMVPTRKGKWRIVSKEIEENARKDEGFKK